MGKYRHKVTGKVAEFPDDYARVIKALERVDEDTPADADCIPCGPQTAPSAAEFGEEKPSGEVSTADEPDFYLNDEE